MYTRPPSAGSISIMSLKWPYQPPQKNNPQWKQEMLDGKMKIGCAINTSSGLATELCASLGAVPDQSLLCTAFYEHPRP